MAWYLVLHFSMVAKLCFTPGHSYLKSTDLLGYFMYSGKNLKVILFNFHHDSVPKETWSSLPVKNFHDDWAPSQTPVLSVT